MRSRWLLKGKFHSLNSLRKRMISLLTDSTLFCCICSKYCLSVCLLCSSSSFWLNSSLGKNSSHLAFYALRHYENMPMQYKEIFKVVKYENFPLKNIDIFLIFAQNIDCGYTLEPPRRGGSNEYPQSMF